MTQDPSVAVAALLLFFLEKYIADVESNKDVVLVVVVHFYFWGVQNCIIGSHLINGTSLITSSTGKIFLSTGGCGSGAWCSIRCGGGGGREGFDGRGLVQSVERRGALSFS